MTSARTSSASIDESLESERPRLSVELVPATCWLSNLRSELPRQAWDALRRRTYENAGYLCDVCSGRGPTHPVECHEQWSYDDAALVQRLVCRHPDQASGRSSRCIPGWRLSRSKPLPSSASNLSLIHI